MSRFLLTNEVLKKIEAAWYEIRVMIKDVTKELGEIREMSKVVTRHMV